LSTFSRRAEHQAAAERAARQALALDPNLAEGHLALAVIDAASSRGSKRHRKPMRWHPSIPWWLPSWPSITL
jgi:hypothetical protein